MKITDEREQYGQISCQVEPSDSFSTFGGEYSDGEYEFAEYGLDMGDVCFYGISPSQLKQFGAAIINHLMTCGHDFEIGKDHNGEFLKEK